jgi:hypothetical protein
VARELGDVLHYFLEDAVRAHASRRVHTPVGTGEVLRAGWLWNLALELRERGCASRLVAPAGGALAAFAGADATLAPSEGELDSAFARAARELPVAEGGRWLFLLAPRAEAPCAPDLLLLLVTPDPADQARACAQVAERTRRRPCPRVGVTVHGVRDLAHAEETYLAFAERCGRACEAPLTSYGVLLDDLAVYRAVGERRSLRARGCGEAVRSLADVARLLVLDDAQAAPA